jgi:predicted pyridoxine 5'-phosphate oxidase superfamily flavin-nucleotide-binding protein
MAMKNAKIPSDIAFTNNVKAIQTRKGSRRAYANMENGVGWATSITADLAAFISEQTSVFLATANLLGQPYIQHRGGPPGFLRVLDDTTIAFADFRGNRQYITTGNLSENPRAHLFMIDYRTRQRVKFWGTARVIDDNPGLLAQLIPRGYKAQGEQVISFHVETWDANCPQHIPQRFDASDLLAALKERDQRIVDLEAEIARQKIRCQNA